MPIRPDDFDAPPQRPRINMEDSVPRNFTGNDARAKAERDTSALVRRSRKISVSSQLVWIIAAVVGLILVASEKRIGASYIVSMFHKNGRLQEPITKDWTQVRYNDPDLSHCGGVQICAERKAHSDSLTTIKDWTRLSYDNPLLADCMNYPPCIDRMKHAQKLISVKNWGKLADKELLADCMKYPPCEKHNSSRTVRLSCADIAENYPCCQNAPDSDQDRCRKCKKEENMADCTGIYPHKNF